MNHAERSASIRSLVRRAAARLPLPLPVLALVLAVPALVGFDFGPTSSCGAFLEVIRLPSGVELCSHGPDRAPGSASAEGSDDDYTVAGAVSPSEAVPADAVQCFNDGADGRRVQVLYAHEAGTPDRAASLDAELRRWVGQAEWTLRSSAAETGGRRHIRFVTEPTGDGCRARIGVVRLPSGAFDSFGDTLTALTDAGYDRSDRKYLIFADVNLGVCGLATVPNDDRKVSDNRANVWVGYARVDADCWDTADRGFYSVAAHELIHTLGGVQPSAPNATEGRHCTDEWDALCYSDGSGATTTRCADDDPDTFGDADAYNRLLDCGNDDYFHTSPPAGSYLATHWNTADSVFLSDRTGASTLAMTSYRDDVAEDPRGRPMTWSGDLGGAVRPLLPHAHGWETCDLPITVLVAGPTSSGGGTLGGLLGGGSSEPEATPLRSAVQRAVTAVNTAVGSTVLTVADAAWDGSALTDGQLGVRYGATVAHHHVDVTVRDVRIRRTTLTLDAALETGPAAVLSVTVHQGLARALGLGVTDTTGELMSRTPVAGASTTIADAALRHLYATPCSKDARLDDSLGGPRSQRVTAGTRQTIDLAEQAADPIAAAVDVARWLTTDRGAGWAQRAIVCRDDVHADCLAGTALAGDAGPVLFVPGGPDGSLPSSVRDVLRDALRTGAEVHVLGGPAAVSDRVVDGLREALPGRRVGRVAGENRYATAVAVARIVAANGGDTRTALLTRADDPADAVAAGAAAAELGVPVLLTATDRLPEDTELALTELGTRTVLITGGHAAVSAQVERHLSSQGLAVSRMSGRDRFETAVAIARAPALWDRTEVVRSGSVIGLNGRHAQTWNLALAAAPVGAYLDAPVLFTTADTLPSRPASGGFAGGTLEQLRGLAFRATAPEVRTIFVGAGTWAAHSTADRFHAQALPGFGGNLTVR